MLFDVPSMPDYGRLSNRSLEEMEAGARVDVAPYKKGPDGLRAVEAVQARRAVLAVAGGIRCGPARLAHRVLGDGGEALWARSSTSTAAASTSCFPHHENEIAQSRCAHGTPVMANYWMHNGFLQVEGEKMSKSLGNFVTIHELLATQSFGGQPWHGRVVALAMLGTHYRQPIDWTVEGWCRRASHADGFVRASCTMRRSPPSLIADVVAALSTISTRRAPCRSFTASPSRRTRNA